ncbi:hypothetical protein [Microtetraspora glauca]|uniref:Uncharacterized protein n=1 Tax=Microtetraspora glauca TaxID=1996 RepID=A0ABV3GEL3_MICGL
MNGAHDPESTPLTEFYRFAEASGLAGRLAARLAHGGVPLYRELGFFDHPDPALCWRP